ncbi:MAG: ubiquinone/menaquinone biosynthesis methyltransferase [Alphaproteobacteria bacterium]|jgi:demethylmenaquinone methyltransferase/2-methoxy-6-polyprenyl-1,4-benzoquinol methylase|nr:ubiquinone/menaquinone biosynthesis methyltransferase [Alphaproteobacteria bacterium]
MADLADRLARSFGYEEIDPAAKADRVRGVFDRVAARYDLMNDLMSLGVHRLWKDALVDWLAPRAGILHADLGGGTGDVALRVRDRTDAGADVVVVDVNPPMLRVGRDRALDTNRFTGLFWVAGDAMALPLPDRAIDSATIAFAMRNVTHVDRALAEIRRVLKPGGRFLCLEFSKLTLPVLDAVYERYSFTVLPALGRMVAGDAASYRYLAESIRRFPDQEGFAELMWGAGFERVRWRNLSAGIACIHSGWRL